MAKIVSYSGKIPKRIFDNYLIYKLGEDLIIREKTGFTTEELLKSAKYANCRKNASEFGRVSKACKGLRVLLDGILPKKNNLAVVNALTKHMRSLLLYDTKHIRGERTLASALAQVEGSQLFMGYSFNPMTCVQMSTKVVDERLELSNIILPEGVSWVGFRLHVVAYDWDAFEGKLTSGGWHFEQHGTEGLSYGLPKVEAEPRTLVYLVEVQFFSEKDGAFMPVRTEEKGVFVVDYRAGLAAELEGDEERGCPDDSLFRSFGAAISGEPIRDYNESG